MKTIPSTFLSEAAIAEAVDAAFAEALAQELEAALADEPPARPGIVLPDTDILIAQAGIATGPCPPDPRIPSRSAEVAKVSGRLAGRAAWWLLKATAYVTAVVLRVVIVIAWELVFGGGSSAPKPQLQEVPPPRPTGRDILASDFLEATSAEIGHRGWTQFRRESSTGAVCMIGAEQSLIRSGTGTWTTASSANGYFLQLTGARSVPRWNDRITRRETQVHTALLAAAARARAVGE